MSYSVYAVVEKCTGRVKVGKSKTKLLRSNVSGNTLSQLQRGNPDELYLAWSREYRGEEDALDAEECAHNELERLWIRGEWFRPQALRLLPGILDDCEKYRGIRPI